jgi:hypothetical protein
MPAPLLVRQGSTVATVGGALLGTATGALVGGFIGAEVTSRGCAPGDPDGCLGQALPGYFWGAVTGITIGAPAGAHVANGRRGSLPRALLVSSAVFVAELIALNLLVEDGRTEHPTAAWTVAISGPILQVVAAVFTERRTAARAAPR